MDGLVLTAAILLGAACAIVGANTRAWPAALAGLGLAVLAAMSLAERLLHV